MATLEEIEQQVADLRDLITTPYQPPSGPEQSFPIVNAPLSDEQWQLVTLGLGDGVLDQGGQPYWMRGRENANNTLRITTSTTTGDAQAVLRGFYHRMVEDKVFTVPGVTANTLFHFCLTYDPLGHSKPEGPITLEMYAGAPPLTLGRFHAVLWTLLRRPNQLLTDATVKRVRPKVTPMLTVDREDDRPPVEKVLWGTRVLCTESGIEYRAYGSGDETDGPTDWREVALAQDWTDLGLGSSYKTAGTPCRYRVYDGYLELFGDVRNTGGTALPTGAYQTFGWVDSKYSLRNMTIGTVGNGARPVSVTTVMGSSGSRDTLRFFARESGTTQFSLDGLRFPLT